MNWLNLLESHFNHRKKAFLVFDNNHLLRYVSEYAKEILGIDESHIGFVSLTELFPPTDKNPQFLIDKNYSYQAVQDINYTTPSGLFRELRITKDPEPQTVGDFSGYIVWLEAKSRDITAGYKKVSSLDPFLNFGWLFEQNAIGFLLINKEGLIEKYNEKMKMFLNEPGEWLGRNIFTFPFVHQHGIASSIMKSMKSVNKPQSNMYALKYHGINEPLKIKWSSLPLTDLEGSIVGAIITASPSNQE